PARVVAVCHPWCRCTGGCGAGRGPALPPTVRLAFPLQPRLAVRCCLFAGVDAADTQLVTLADGQLQQFAQQMRRHLNGASLMGCGYLPRDRLEYLIVDLNADISAVPPKGRQRR